MALAKDAAGAVIGSVIMPFGILAPLHQWRHRRREPMPRRVAKAKAPSGTTRARAASQPVLARAASAARCNGVGEGLRNLFGK